LKYQLNDNDYRSLWMVASPSQIKAEFGDRSCSVRTIYRIYAKYGISGIKNFRSKIRSEIRKESGSTISEEYISHKLEKRFEIEREAAFIKMWKKIREFEGRF